MFAGVTDEVRRLLDADLTTLAHYDADGAMTTVARWSAARGDQGDRFRSPLGGRNVATLVFETGRPARMDDFCRASGPAAGVARKHGIRSSSGYQSGSRAGCGAS